MSQLSTNNKFLIAAGIAFVLILLYLLLPKNQSLKESERTSMIPGNAPKDFHGIPPEGTGGDPDLNRMKNRWFASTSVSEMSIAQIIALPHEALDMMNKEHRSRSSRTARLQAESAEERSVQITGFIANVTDE